MKKAISIILVTLLILTTNINVFATEDTASENTITFTQFMDVNRDNVSNVQIYTLGETYELDIQKFFGWADRHTITKSAQPYSIPNDGIYIGIVADGVLSCTYISMDGGVDRAVPAAGRPLEALYTLDDTNGINGVMALMPHKPSSDEINSENSMTLRDVLTDELSHVNYDDCKQPHSSWAFSLEEKDEILKFFESVIVEPAEIQDNLTQQYNLDVFTTDDNIYKVRIYDNGIVTRETLADAEIDLCCKITDYEAFKSVMDRHFSTQSTGYGRAMPGKQQTLEISGWAQEYYEKAKEYNLLPPYMTMGFMTDNITREQFCDIAINLLADFPVDESTEKEFEDTVNPNVLRLADKGMILGKSDTKFAPNDFITREEAAVILSRLALERMDGITTTDEYIEFDDSDMISRWADHAIQIICKIGIMNGVGNNKFAPQEGYTIEQSLTTAVRLYEYFAAYAPKPGPYTYETPYGTVVTEKDSSSWVNFAIECDAVLGVVKDTSNFEGTHFMIEKPVKAFTDGMGSQYISFDTFADIFDGEWKLADGVFEFTYDPAKEVALVDYVPVDNPDDAVWPNTTDAIDVLQFSEMNTIKVNGVETELHGQYGGRVTRSCIMMFDGELYIHVQTFAELLGCDVGTLNPIL